MAAHILTVLVSLLSLAPGESRVVFDRPIDETYHIRVMQAPLDGSTDRMSTVRVLLIDRAAPPRRWELASLRVREDHIFAVERATARVLVLYWRSDPYGTQDGYLKLFLDLKAKRIEKQIEYEVARDIAFADDRHAQDALGISARDLDVLRERRVFSSTGATPDLPREFATHRLPQSTTAQVLAQRPHFKAYGLDEPIIDGIEETIGAYQHDGERIWFGKSFYDAEGQTGIGAIGYLDAAGRYTFLNLREIVDWSVSSMLVDDRTVWAGLVHHGEGRDQSGGLLHYDRKTGTRVVHQVPDVIHSIAHVNGAVHLGTDRGLYVIRNGTLTRYRMERTITGEFVVISQRP